MAKIYAAPFVQFARGILDSEWPGQNKIKIELDIGGGPLTSTQTIPAAPAPTSYLYNSRDGAANDLCGTILPDLLTAAEVALGSNGVWSTVWDEHRAGAEVEGYFYLLRTGGAALVSFAILWTDSASTAPAAWFGFDAASDAVMEPLHIAATEGIYSTWQAGAGLWIPGRIPKVAHPFDVVSVRTRMRPFDGELARQEYGSHTVWDIQLEQVRGLMFRAEASARADYLAARSGVVAGDPNVALATSWRRFASQAGPWVYFSDLRFPGDTAYQFDLEAFNPEHLADLRNFAKMGRIARELWSVGLILKSWLNPAA